MATIKILGMKGSTCSRRIFATLEEVGQAYDFELINLMKGEHQTPEYKALQPFGKIPVLKEGDFTLYESRAIIRYIANVHDKSGKLYPADAKAKALVEQWISVEQSYYPADQLVGQLLFAPMMGGQTDEAAVAKADAQLHTGLAVIDAHLAKSKFFAGEEFTLADIVYLPYTQLILTAVPRYADLTTKYPNFGRWWKEASSRPSWQKVIKESEF